MKCAMLHSFCIFWKKCAKSLFFMSENDSTFVLNWGGSPFKEKCIYFLIFMQVEYANLLQTKHSNH